MNLQKLHSLQSESHLTSQEQKQCGITEILLPQGNWSFVQSMIVPMLAHLSAETPDKWLTWIAPHKLSPSLSKALLKHDAFPHKNVRLVHIQDEEAYLWAFWEALANPNSATVVSTLPYLSEKDRLKLEAACNKGGTRGIVLRQR